MKRCKDCKYYRVRVGCVHPNHLTSPNTVAICPPKYEVYRKTDCPLWEANNESVQEEPDETG